MRTIFLALPLLLIGCATERGGSDSSLQATTGSGSHAVAATDSSFAREACQAGAAELHIGKLATRNTRNKEVRALAKKLADNHTQAEKELAAIFARKNLPPEKELAPHLQNSLDRLAGLKGREFDQAFKDQVIQDQESAIELFEKQLQQGSDPDLKAFAQRYLPRFRDQLAMAERLEISTDTGSEPNPTPADVLANPATRPITVPR
jgi:putative membrane protein